MPSGQPFTRLCEALSRKPLAERADLHLHSLASDGLYSPKQLVELAVRSGLAAIALTDHDTLDGIAQAREAASSSDVEIISGVEITCEHRARELHVLAYFVSDKNEPLLQAMEHLRVRREVRFREMVDRLKKQGVSLDADVDSGRRVLGRRNLAELLLAQGKVGSIREAFQRYLRDGGVAAVEKTRLPVEQAFELVRKAGGVASYAHPSYHSGMEQDVKELAGLGLGALEVEYPEFTRTQKQSLRDLATRYNLAVSGGSDCHGQGNREVGSSTISLAELEKLRHWRG